MKYVVIGASAAGVSGIRELRKLDTSCEIVLISKDTDIYSRCILHRYLGGERSLEKLNFVEENFTELYNVQWIKGMACTGVKTEEKKVMLEDGQEVAYDKLLIATGSHTFIPPIPNLAGAKNVVGFRNVDDIEALKEAAKTKKNFFVMGGGLVGLDCTSGLLELGLHKKEETSMFFDIGTNGELVIGNNQWLVAVYGCSSCYHIALTLVSA